MRYFLSAVLISFLLVQFSCTVNDREETIHRDPEPILEIWQDIGGMVEITGRSLFLRMYSDGFVEYEVPDRSKATTANSKRLDDIKTLKNGYLSNRRRESILKILRSTEIPKLKSTYEQGPCLDTSHTLDININISPQKKIVRIEDCDRTSIIRTEHPTRQVLPRVIAELITETNIVRIN